MKETDKEANEEVKADEDVEDDPVLSTSRCLVVSPSKHSPDRHVEPVTALGEISVSRRGPQGGSSQLCDSKQYDNCCREDGHSCWNCWNCSRCR